MKGGEGMTRKVSFKKFSFIVPFCVECRKDIRRVRQIAVIDPQTGAVICRKCKPKREKKGEE